VWRRFGDISNYIEPFFGSGAVLLRRPHPPKIETVNDINCYVANFWRATREDPEAVAVWADDPVSEADLHARHRWLVLGDAAEEFRSRMRTDPDFYDPKVAGWWAWGACCWIGSGWCDTPESAEWEQVPLLRGDAGAAGMGIHASGAPGLKRPKLSGGSPDSGALGTGVHANGRNKKESATWDQMPELAGWNGKGGHGVHAKGPAIQRPVLEDRGIHVAVPDGHRPQLADAFSRGRGVHGNDSAGTCAERRAWLIDWFSRLRDRLRTVRVCCGDWERVCGSNSVTTRLGLTGIFLDPPYPTHAADGSESRAAGLYASDGDRDALDRLRDEVLAYCRERGADPLMRICVAGYDTDGYAALEGLGWACVEWKASGGYGNRSAKGKGNAARERLYFSPHCLEPGKVAGRAAVSMQLSLAFGDDESPCP
jgi:hypothetical protein